MYVLLYQKNVTRTSEKSPKTSFLFKAGLSTLVPVSPFKKMLESYLFKSQQRLYFVLWFCDCSEGEIEKASFPRISVCGSGVISDSGLRGDLSARNPVITESLPDE